MNIQNPPTPPHSLPTVTLVEHYIIIDGLPNIDPISKRYTWLDNCALMNIVHSYKHLLTHGSRDGRKASATHREAGTLENDEFELPIGYTSKILVRADNTIQLAIHIFTNVAAEAIIRDTIPIDNSLADEIVDNGLVVADSQSYRTQTIILKANTSKIDASWMRYLRKANQPKPKKKPPIREGFRKMTPTEVKKYLDRYCSQCAESIRRYLENAYEEAAKSCTQPDFFGLPPQVN